MSQRRVISRTEGGMNMKLHTFTDADARCTNASQANGRTGVAAQLGSLRGKQRLTTDRRSGADRPHEALIAKRMPSRSLLWRPHSKAVKHDERGHNGPQPDRDNVRQVEGLATCRTTLRPVPKAPPPRCRPRSKRLAVATNPGRRSFSTPVGQKLALIRPKCPDVSRSHTDFAG